MKMDPTTNGAHLRTDAGICGRPLRLALYSHDAMGVGHVRRNLLIAQSLSESPVHATSLMLCGVHEATSFAAGNGIDCMTLPSLRKYGNDDYRPRDLKLTGESVCAIRKATLQSALLAFEPDILLVDKLPRGLKGELHDVIPMLRKFGTKIVFGMRDILDSVERVGKEWKRQDNAAYIQEHYDQVWIYGSPEVYDPIAEYQLGEIGDQVRYTGYIDQRVRLDYASPITDVTDEQREACRDGILCTVGGGEDGRDLALAFAQAELPHGMKGLLVAGPLMLPRDRMHVEALVKQRSDMHFLGSVREADLLTQTAARVICMGGYNSTLSVVSFEKSALIVPRVSPRLEQHMRASRFAELGLVDFLHPTELTSDRISAWLENSESNAKPRREQLNLNGLRNITQYVSDLMTARRQPMAPPLITPEVSI